jgi:hypothetical protein
MGDKKAACEKCDVVLRVSGDAAPSVAETRGTPEAAPAESGEGGETMCAEIG